MRKRSWHFLGTLWSAFLLYSGLWFLLQRCKRPRILVLAYHRIVSAEAETPWFYPERCVSTATFEKQLLALRRSYRFIGAAELDAVLSGEKRLDRHVALLTFDDGYQDVYERALPILRKHGIPAICFLSLGFVEDRRSFWFDRLAQGLDAWDREARERARLRPLLPRDLAAAFESRAARAERLQRAVSFLVRLPVRERRSLMKRLMPQLLSRPSRTPAEALTWSQVRELRRAGVVIGAHGCSHTQLTRLSREDAWREVQQSLDGVARGSGGGVDAFAYPHGAVDDDIVRWVGETGVRLAFTLEPRENRPSDDPLRLGRRNVCEASSRGLRGRFSAARFLCAMSGYLPGVETTPRRHRSAGAALVGLAWTGPQEASARVDAPMPGGPNLPAAAVPSPVPRPGSPVWPGSPSPR